MQGRGLRRLDACQASPRSCFPSGTDAAAQKTTRQNTKEMCCFVGKPRPSPLKPLTSKLNAAVQCYTSCLFQK